jgi:hypothetical protein
MPAGRIGCDFCRRDVGVSPATVSQVLRRLGLSKFKALESVEPFGRARTSALTPNADIKINERVSLRPIWIGLAWLKSRRLRSPAA